jgi:hypothetical protein
MTATAAPAVRTSLVRVGTAVTVGAAAANLAVAVVARAAGVSLDVPAGEVIPLLAFPQLTAIAALLGLVLAVALRRRAARPARAFQLVAYGLTVLSLVAPILAPADGATKVTLIVTHLLAADIVIPPVARRLS